MRLFDVLTAGKANRLHAWNGSEFETISYDDVVRNAERIASGLRQAGVEPGTPVASIITNTGPAVSGLLGVWLAGGAVASLPVPARGMTFDEYVEQISTIRERLGSPVLVTEQRFVDALDASPADVGVPIKSWEELSSDRPIDPSPPGEDDVAFIQYSSGSTNMPKGCMLTTRAIGRHMDTIGDRIEVRPGEDVGVSWLPLSHDMGMFGCLMTAWVQDCDMWLSAPERFLANPRSWFGDCADVGATLTAGPPSALPFAARSHRKPLSNDLELRVCVLGAERIDWHVLRHTTETLAPFGLAPEVWMPAYGLAEATLMATAIANDEAPSRMVADTLALAEGEIREVAEDHGSTTSIMNTGRPADGVSVRLDPDDRLGEILIRSESLFSGYYGDDERTASRVRDGEFATGDLGFMKDGELYVVGRSDDLLNVGGRNIYAREIEAAVDLLEGVRSGCSTIVDAGDGESSGDGSQRLVMLLELRDEGADVKALAGAAARTATAKAGVPLDECVFLPKGALPKTPSGKIQRFRCRQLVLADRLEPIARVEL